MTITITHPRGQGHWIRNTMMAAVVAILVGGASYGIAEIAIDRGSAPASLSETAIETNTFSEAAPTIQNSAESLRGLAPAGAVVVTPSGDVSAQFAEWLRAEGLSSAVAVTPSVDASARIAEFLKAESLRGLAPAGAVVVTPSGDVSAQFAEWLRAEGLSSAVAVTPS